MLVGNSVSKPHEHVSYLRSDKAENKVLVGLCSLLETMVKILFPNFSGCVLSLAFL